MSDISDSRTPREGAEQETGSVTTLFRDWFRSVLRGRGDTTLRDTIEELIEENDDDGDTLGDSERLLLSNILKLRDRKVVDVMIPRVDIVAVDVDTPVPALLQRFAEEAHSRMPVFRETLDEVVGLVHIKDVLTLVTGQKRAELRDVVRELSIVAPSMSVLDLLLQMRQTRQHMALVVDEFGGIDGLVTIEDLVEEIVGEIEDEHDEAATPQLVERADGSLNADARVSIEEFEARVGEVLSEEEREHIDTLGGFVVSLAGRVPGRGELLRHPSGLEFEIIDADPRRLKRLRIRNVPAVATPEPANGEVPLAQAG